MLSAERMLDVLNMPSVDQTMLETSGTTELNSGVHSCRQILSMLLRKHPECGFVKAVLSG